MDNMKFLKRLILFPIGTVILGFIIYNFKYPLSVYGWTGKLPLLSLYYIYGILFMAVISMFLGLRILIYFNNKKRNE